MWGSSFILVGVGFANWVTAIDGLVISAVLCFLICLTTWGSLVPICGHVDEDLFHYFFGDSILLQWLVEYRSQRLKVSCVVAIDGQTWNETLNTRLVFM